MRRLDTNTTCLLQFDAEELRQNEDREEYAKENGAYNHNNFTPDNEVLAVDAYSQQLLLSPPFFFL
jgi:hypothetical protein